MSNINCILYPPTLEYDYLVQRPQQLMRSFSELGITAFFLNNSNAYTGEEQGIRKLNDSFYLVNNVDPTPFLGGRKPIVYYTSTAHVELVNYYNPDLVIFDSVDEPSEEFESWRPNYHKAVSSADIVLTASDKLYSMAAAINPRTYLVPNACDYDYFSGIGGLEADGDILSINKPIIGYIGVVASWCDLDLIAQTADKFSHCNLVMIGPLYNISEVPQRPNLHWLGFKSYEKLAAYARLFDVGIIPFKKTSMTESVNPIKMWEYMATGMPVVATALPEANKHGDLVLYSEDWEQFMNNLNIALYHDSQEKRVRRQEAARQNSWLERAKQIVEIIEEEMQARNIISPYDPVSISEDALQNSQWGNMPSYIEDFNISPFRSRVTVGRKIAIHGAQKSYNNPVPSTYNFRRHIATQNSRANRITGSTPRVTVKRALKL